MPAHISAVFHISLNPLGRRRPYGLSLLPVARTGQRRTLRINSPGTGENQEYLFEKFMQTILKINLKSTIFLFLIVIFLCRLRKGYIAALDCAPHGPTPVLSTP
jgi:hypothetical protein